MSAGPGGKPGTGSALVFRVLVAQAGLTLGLAIVVERTFPSFGTAFRALTIATVAINELVGPVLF